MFLVIPSLLLIKFWTRKAKRWNLVPPTFAHPPPITYHLLSSYLFYWGRSVACVCVCWLLNIGWSAALAQLLWMVKDTTGGIAARATYLLTTASEWQIWGWGGTTDNTCIFWPMEQTTKNNTKHGQVFSIINQDLADIFGLTVFSFGYFEFGYFLDFQMCWQICGSSVLMF